MIIRLTNRNGERVIKNLDNGKSDYVKHQPIQNPVMSDEVYKNTYGRPKHDLGVVINKSDDFEENSFENNKDNISKRNKDFLNNIKTMIEERDKFKTEVFNKSDLITFNLLTNYLQKYGEENHPQNDNKEQDEVLNKEELDVLNKLNKLTTIGLTNNEGISPILKKHFNNIWNYNFDVFGLSKDGVDSFKTAKDMFKLVIESIDGALDFYKKCIKYLEDLWEFSASLCNVEDFCFDFSEETPKVVYNNEVIRINLVKVSKILDLVTIVGFPNGNLNNNVVADRVFEPDFINLSSKISYIGKTNDDMVYPCMHKSKNTKSTKMKVKLVNNDSDENLSNY